MVASRGGYRMARGRHYAKLSLSNAARLSFSDLCILLFMFLSLCRLCVCVFLCSHWSLVDVPLIFFCPADHVPDWQPRVLLGMVEARSVNVKKTTTTYIMPYDTAFEIQYLLLYSIRRRTRDTVSKYQYVTTDSTVQDHALLHLLRVPPLLCLLFEIQTVLCLLYSTRRHS